MTRSRRRVFIFPAVLLVLITLVSSGRFEAPASVSAQAAGPAFTPLSVYDTRDTPQIVMQPPRLLAGTNSHALPANADPAIRNGYCLDVNIPGITPATRDSSGNAIPEGDLGFRITGKNTPTGTATVLPGAVADTDRSGRLLTPGDSSDDVYCVVVAAPTNFSIISITWYYVDADGDLLSIALPDGSDADTLADDILIRTVTLRKVGDGLVGAPLGAPAEVCTVGWDAAFMTGQFTNTNSNAPGDPDPIDDLSPQDFVLTGETPAAVVSSVRSDGSERCALIRSSTTETNVDVTLNFAAVYNRVTPETAPSAVPSRLANGDDQNVSVSLPDGPGLRDRRVNIAAAIELRHIFADGQPLPRRESPLLVVGTLHTVCIIGSGAGDTLTSSGIVISPVLGSPTVQNLTVGPPPAGTAVDPGTLCFSWTSTSPGEQTARVTFSDNGVPREASFDTNADGNGLDEEPNGPDGVTDTGPAGPLLTRWDVVAETRITRGGDPDADIVTFTTVNVPLTFNVGNGSLTGSLNLTEWVLGTAVADRPTASRLLDGIRLQARITGDCGFFEVPDDSMPTTINGTSISGRFELNNGSLDPEGPAFGDTDREIDDLQFRTGGGGCTVRSTARIEVDVYYPGASTPAIATEYVNITFSLASGSLPNKTPRVAWAGQVVSTTYAFASNNCPDEPVHFVRGANQPGSFIGSPGVTVLGPDRAVGILGDNCSISALYESEDPGEVDIEVYLDSNPFSKVAFPIYYMIFEDIQIEATPDSVVSTVGDVTANVRGWFPGSNPSGRPAEVKPDGRAVPANRWVLPDDWETVSGNVNGRGINLDMPPATVTFLMENEGIRNSYKGAVKGGGLGWMLPDDPSDFSFNVDPTTAATTVLGTAARPRMVSSTTDSAGGASIDTFGDLNLSFEDCPPNSPPGTGNPLCEPEDIVGRTRYFAVADYQSVRGVSTRGKFPAIRSNTSETIWRWAGYKQVAIVNTDSPQIKYVVVQLRDRDGFCDAADFNNVLGIPITFQIDAGDGVIIEAADQPATISNNRRFATATTFDTQDDLGQPMNEQIARPVIAEDECQAWIKISNSLLNPTNVLITIPAPPSPIPGDVRITGLQCRGDEPITVTNLGTKDVNLAGFSIQSENDAGLPSAAVQIPVGATYRAPEYLGLSGLLKPGQSATFIAGIASESLGWRNTDGLVFGRGPGDDARLIWNGFEVSRANCDGTFVNPPLPASFPSEGEGEIVFDLTIPFGAETVTPLVEGWNLVTAGVGSTPLTTALSGFEGNVAGIYTWDVPAGIWRRYLPGAPNHLQTISALENGQIYWVHVKQPFTLTLTK